MMDKKTCRRKVMGMLTNYKSNQVAIAMLEADLRALEARGIDDLGVSYDRPKSSRTNRVVSRPEEEVIRLEQERCRIIDQIALMQNQLDKVDIALAHLERPYRLLLQLKYIEHKRWVEIYQQINYSEEYIRGKMNEAALDMLAALLFPQPLLLEA